MCKRLLLLLLLLTRTLTLDIGGQQPTTLAATRLQMLRWRPPSEKPFEWIPTLGGRVIVHSCFSSTIVGVDVLRLAHGRFGRVSSI